ncbi:olfactory receptor 10A7-like [Emydura macquarii macquarii]|uniref:olfactory receptor 10A7-like n=1 Tax=Emydura macquarii macquarii TaxID=1129001 RepID=UPI00352B0341
MSPPKLLAKAGPGSRGEREQPALTPTWGSVEASPRYPPAWELEGGPPEYPTAWESEGGPPGFPADYKPEENPPETPVAWEPEADLPEQYRAWDPENLPALPEAWGPQDLEELPSEDEPMELPERPPVDEEGLIQPMEDTKWGNQTAITEFILLGFGNLPELRLLLFLLFLAIYIVTVAGNILIVALVVADQHLQTPMYFFLGNLSCMEICYSSTVLPRLLASFLTGDRRVSFTGCFLQFYVCGSLGYNECILLSVMSYDRYLAICNPLHYSTVMNVKVCTKLASTSWITGFLALTITVLSMLTLTFCGPNEIDNFFCDLMAMLKLSCTDTHQVRLVAFVLVSVGALPPFLLTVASYVYIIISILRIHSTTGRKKAFSTCSSHLIVVTIFYGTLIIVYLTPTVDTWKELNKIFPLFYTVLTPAINPLIYSLRNNEVKEALRRATNEWMPSRRGHHVPAVF